MNNDFIADRPQGIDTWFQNNTQSLYDNVRQRARYSMSLETDRRVDDRRTGYERRRSEGTYDGPERRDKNRRTSDRRRSENYASL